MRVCIDIGIDSKEDDDIDDAEIQSHFNFESAFRTARTLQTHRKLFRIRITSFG